MLTSLKRFERAIAMFLSALIALATLLATANLAIDLFKDVVWSEPRLLVNVDALLSVFGQVLIILLGFELLEIVKAYLRDDAVHVEVVLVVALISLARKAMLIETSAASGTVMIGLASLILSIAGGYWLVMRILRPFRKRAS